MHNSPKENAKLAQVRALLANAEDPGTPPEAAENYRARAFDLMAKYGIEQAQLAEEQPGRRDEVTDKVINVDNPWAMNRTRLLAAVARAMRCEVIYGPRKDGKKGKRVRLFGYESDLHRVDILYTSLLLQMTKELDAAVIPPMVDGVAAWRHSWLVGFVAKVGERLKVAEQIARDETPQIAGRSTALVLADRSKAAERAMRAAYPKIRKGGKTSIRSGDGFGQGQAAGARADIGNGRIGGRARGAIGR